MKVSKVSVQTPHDLCSLSYLFSIIYFKNTLFEVAKKYRNSLHLNLNIFLFLIMSF